MDRVDVKELKSKIENLVEEGMINEGDLISVEGLQKDSTILLTGSFAGDKKYIIEKEAHINPEDPQTVTYTLYIKYLGDQNA
jgi:hypothetical protein